MSIEERYVQLEQTIGKVAPEFLDALYPPIRLVFLQEENFATDLSDEGLRRLGAIVKVICRHGAVLVISNSRGCVITSQMANIQITPEGKTEGDSPRK